MKLFNRLTVLSILGLCGLGLGSLGAEEVTLNLDTTASEVVFTLGSTLHEVKGRLHLTRGQVDFDTEGGPAEGLIVLDARKTETGNAKRDRKMHLEVLESARFPRFEFTPKFVRGKLPQQGKARIRLEGQLTLHGSEHSVVLEVEARRTAEGLDATFELPIPFVDWGLKDPSVFVLRTDKVVQVRGRIRGKIRPRNSENSLSGTSSNPP